MIVEDDQEVILIADSGKMIRMGLDKLRIIGRTTQGVTLINLEEGERVVAMDILAHDDSADIEEDVE
jgi:DNA gyrase subunit A